MCHEILAKPTPGFGIYFTFNGFFMLKYFILFLLIGSPHVAVFTKPITHHLTEVGFNLSSTMGEIDNNIDQNQYSVAVNPDKNYVFRDPFGQNTPNGYLGFKKDSVPIADTTWLRQLSSVEILSNFTGSRDGCNTTKWGKTELQKLNNGRDMPMILESMPSVVTTSDAGNGIGYTSMRIRGVDQTRINININGVQLNEVESHQVFWVDLPDFASSVQQIQVSRGLSVSSNGSGSFGANISLMTNNVTPLPYANIDLGVGSFNSRRQSVSFGTGTLKNGLSLEGRLSNIQSDGFVDRAKSDLQSLFGALSYMNKKSIFKLLAWTGRETTYQSWNGVPESRFKNDQAGMQSYIDRNFITEQEATRLLNSDQRYNVFTYENQNDNFKQDHVQFIGTHAFDSKWSAGGIFHARQGSGFYEEYRTNDNLNNYVDTGDTIIYTNLVRERWLSNLFGGARLFVNYEGARLTSRIGLISNFYNGTHFGKINWTQNNFNLTAGQEYYRTRSNYTEMSAFVNQSFHVNDRLDVHADVQVRKLKYECIGIENGKTPVNITYDYLFVNPKIGASYAFLERSILSGSYSYAQAPPLREDFIQNQNIIQPQQESMQNMELGIQTSKGNFTGQVNIYGMFYKNQLVQTGKINDTGAALRVNIPNSYRIGTELQAKYQLSTHWDIGGNYTWSRNKIKAFEEEIFNYDNGAADIVFHENKDISFSPNGIGFAQLNYSKQVFHASVSSKYVGRQYLDNTQNKSRSLDPYNTINTQIGLHFKPSWCKAFDIIADVYNLLNVRYANNGYTYSYTSGQLVTENFVFPQAGINGMLTLRVSW